MFFSMIYCVHFAHFDGVFILQVLSSHGKSFYVTCFFLTSYRYSLTAQIETALNWKDVYELGIIWK